MNIIKKKWWRHNNVEIYLLVLFFAYYNTFSETIG